MADDQYFAGKSAAVEAALDIFERGKAREHFVQRLSALFDESTAAKEFYNGWYTVRSLYVHGHSSNEDGARDDDQGLAYFRSVLGADRVTRALARYAILSSLGDDVKNAHFGKWHPCKWLDICLHSRQTWQAIRKTLCASHGADKVSALSDVEWQEIAKTASQFSTRFDWRCVNPQPRTEHVIAAIKTCCLLVTRLSGPDKALEAEVVEIWESLAAGDSKRVEKWLSHRHSWVHFNAFEKNRLAIAKSLLWKLAQFFSAIR